MRRAVAVEAHGGPEVVTIREVPTPQPSPGEVTVAITHVALNHLDLWVRRGVPGHDFHLPRIPGSNAVGLVTGDAHEVVERREAVGKVVLEQHL